MAKVTEAPAPTERRAPRRPSAELQAMAKIDAILSDLTDVQARRVLGWLTSKQMDSLPEHSPPGAPPYVAGDGYSQTEQG